MIPGFTREQIHLFTVEGTSILFDVNSAKFFEIDHLTEEILGLWNSNSEDGIKRVLQVRYAKNELQKALREIKELIKMGLLFREERPESPLFQPSITPRVVTFTLNVVEDCNLRCRYCWNKGGKYGGPGGVYMSKEIARKALNLLVECSRPGDSILVDFYGGEPLLNFGVVKYTIDLCASLQESLDRNFSFKITTNGTLLTDEIVDYLRAHDVSLGVSMDGPREVHNLNRPFPSGKGSWDVIYANISRVLHSGEIPLEVRATLAPPNLNMVEVSRFLRQIGFSQVEMKYANEVIGSVNEGYGLRLDDEDVSKMRTEYLRYAQSYLEELLKNGHSIDVDISNDITNILYQSPKVPYCGAGRSILFVSATGELYPCLNLAGCEEYKLGDVDKGLAPKAVAHFWSDIIKMFEKSIECQGCWAKYVCGENCAANNFRHNGDFAAPYARGCEETRFQKEVTMWLIVQITNKDANLLKRFKPLG